MALGEDLPLLARAGGGGRLGRFFFSAGCRFFLAIGPCSISKRGVSRR